MEPNKNTHFNFDDKFMYKKYQTKNTYFDFFNFFKMSFQCVYT